MLSNCHQCHKPFASKATTRLCPGCTRQEQETYLKLYEYLLKHYASTIDEISEATGVPKDTVIRMINQGKFNLRQNENSACARCCKQLSESDKAAARENGGRVYCRSCTDSMANQLRSLSSSSLSPKPQAPAAAPRRKSDDKRYGLGG